MKNLQKSKGKVFLDYTINWEVLSVRDNFFVKLLNEVRQKGLEKARNHTQQFFLAHNYRKERVCRDLFTKTVDVKRKTIDYTLANKNMRYMEGET